MLTIKPACPIRRARILPSVLAILGIASSSALACAQADAASAEGPSLTVYSSADPGGFDPQRFIAQQRSGANMSYVWGVPGFGVVRETREVEIPKGVGEIRFTDVAAFIDPTTVGFTDLTARGTAVLEQNFEFDLVSPSKLLAKYIDRPITLHQSGDRGQISGTLLSATGSSAVLKTDKSIEIVPISDARISIGELPGGLITQPTLVWKLQSALGGTHKIRTSYQTAGLTWRADYNLTLDNDDTTAEMTAWVSLMNLSGASYENAQLKLVAGDVQRVQPQAIEYGMAAGIAMDSRSRLGAPGFEEQSFFEYHLYTLPRRTDVKSNGTQQLTLFPPVRGFKVEKELLYEGALNVMHGSWPSQPATTSGYGVSANTKIGVFIHFDNKKASGLGMPMPAGKVRVYKANPNDGSLEFLGEDLIDHTPRNEEVRIKVGDSFDVVGERTQVDFKVDTNRKEMTETYTIEIRNQKSDAQTVIVREPLYRWRNWEITKTSEPFKKLDARTIQWSLDVPAEGAKSITYTVRYTW